MLHMHVSKRRYIGMGLFLKTVHYATSIIMFPDHYDSSPRSRVGAQPTSWSQVTHKATPRDSPHIPEGGQIRNP